MTDPSHCDRRPPAQPPVYGVVICTFDRVLDARINQEIVRYHWPATSSLARCVIVHSYNGEPRWYEGPYLEDELVRIPNSGPACGNAELIDHGLLRLHETHPEVRYSVVANADTWLLRPQRLQQILETMTERDQVMAASPWWPNAGGEDFRAGLASDFFLIDVPFAVGRGMIPIDYAGFEERYWDVLLYYASDTTPILEKLLSARLAKGVRNRFQPLRLDQEIAKRLHRLTDREPFYQLNPDFSIGDRIWHWPALGLVSDHDLKRKAALLAAYHVVAGPHAAGLLAAADR